MEPQPSTSRGTSAQSRSNELEGKEMSIWDPDYEYDAEPDDAILHREESDDEDNSAPVSRMNLFRKYRFMTCFLTLALQARQFFNRAGAPFSEFHGPRKADGTRERNKFYKYTSDCDFQLSSTEPCNRKFTKITIESDSKNGLDKGKKVLNMLFNIFGERKYLNEIDPEHCPICFKVGHDGSDCQNCGYCGMNNHQMKDCRQKNRDDERRFARNRARGYGSTSRPEAYEQQEVPERNLNKKQRKNKIKTQKRNQARKEIYNKPAWREKGESIDARAGRCKPIGLVGELHNRKAFALDTEKVTTAFGDRKACQVAVAGFDYQFGIQVIYHTKIENLGMVTSNTPISGFQYQDLAEAKPLEAVKEELLECFRDNAVIVYGFGDLELLNITPMNVQEWSILAENVQKIMGDRHSIISLERLSEFFYPRRDVLARKFPTKPTQGHDCCRDVRITMKIYKKLSDLRKSIEMIPSAEEIKRYTENGENFNGWMRDRILSRMESL